MIDGHFIFNIFSKQILIILNLIFTLLIMTLFPILIRYYENLLAF